jgi:hypothetical protein
MAEELIHGFTGGLNKDLATSLVQADSYIDANNIRIVTQEGQSSGILMNILGNELSFSIPDVGSGFKTYSTSGISSGTYNLSIGGTIVSFVVNYSQPIRPQIQSVLQPYITAGNIFVYINGSELVILEGTSTINLTLVSGTNIVINTVSSITNLQIIGWATIRNTIVLFTCPEVASGTGQIWTVDYDSVTQTTIGPVLKYNQLLNFDSKHPIQAIGRYETSTIQRVYWTDNYNYPRTINLADPNVFDTDIDLVNISSNSYLDVPILNSIAPSGGSLKAGVYQYTYRLKKTNGTYSVFAPLSNLINITQYSEESVPYQNYQGSSITTNSGKAITYYFENTDNSYNLVEHVFIFKDTYNADPQIYIFKEESLSLGTIWVTHSANTGDKFIPITTEELLISTQSDLQRVKTITTKDNMLFFGNTKSDSFNVDFDTRAYRFDGTRVAKLKDDNDSSIFIDGTNPDYTSVPEDHDCINPFNKVIETTISTSDYKYQKDGVTLGGEGPYIKYEFVTRQSVADNSIDPFVTTAPFVASDRISTMQGDTFFTLGIPQQTYEQQNSFYSLKSPYFSSIFTGYARGEVYRFGIVLYDKKGKASYASWIADIKFPEGFTSGYSGNAGNKTYLYNLGVKFTVTIPPAIKNKIEGYSIVRLERPDTEKTRLGTGLVIPIMWHYTADRPSDFSSSLSRNGSETHTLGNAITITGGAINFNNYSFSSGDYLQVIGLMGKTEKTYFDNDGSSATYKKLSWQKPATIKTYDVKSYKLLAPGERVPKTFDTALGDIQFSNAYLSTVGSGFDVDENAFYNNPQGLGDVKGLFCLNSDFTSSLDANDQVLVSINRPLINQYGGNTYSSRGGNVYINCSNYFPIRKASPLGFDVFEVFGGDAFVNYFDVPNFEFNYGNVLTAPWASAGADTKKAQALIFPTESSINTELRQNRHFAKDRNPNDMGLYAFDDFVYNKVYSQQNNTKVYIAKPFIDTTQEEFDTRIWYSKTKINGEQTDNWTFIDGYKDIESVYGPINRLEVLNDNLFAFQDRALANILVNPLSVIQDNNASNLVLGKATGVIQKHIYLSTEIGTKHQWSVVKSDKTIYWFDILGKRLCNIESTTKGAVVLEMSDVKGLISYFQENLKGEVNNVIHNNSGGYLVGDSPTYQYGITAGYDYRNKEVVFTFLDSDKEFTLAYSEVLGKFTSFYSFKPNLYIYTKDKFISTDPTNLNKAYLHNIDNTYGTFYTNNYDSDFSVITNKFPANTKVYDNLELFSEVTINNVDNGSSFNKVQCTTKYQDSGLLTLTPAVSIKRRERSWRLFVPRDTGTTGSSFQARLRDKYLITKLVFTNTGNKKLLLHWLKVLFRASIS